MRCELAILGWIRIKLLQRPKGTSMFLQGKVIFRNNLMLARSKQGTL